MARTRTTKAVAQRIDLNYFKRPTPYKRAKLGLAVVAPVVALVWVGYHFVAKDQRVYSSGRLSQAHSVLETQCAACHIQQPGSFSAAATDAACLACHDGPQHHPEMTAGNGPKPSCASCHTEHRGAVGLAVASAKNCAQCHGDLSVTGPGTKFAKRIQSFENGHPEFAVIRTSESGAAKDPSSIKLNHALHMKAIRRRPSGPTVHLQCSDCHRTSASSGTNWEYGDKGYAAATATYTGLEEFEPGGERGLPTKRPWSDRQLMAPPLFANACAGCHLLTFDKRFDEGVPHDRPDVVHAFLVKKFLEYIGAHPAELHEVQDPRRNLTGRATGPAARTVAPAQWVAERVSVSEELLWHKTCAQCHVVSATALQDVRVARWDAAGGRSIAEKQISTLDTSGTTAAKALPAVAGARTILQWLPHARFDHDAHTGFACEGCHQAALSSRETSDILIPGIAVCQTCHAPGPGFAKADCSECHTYHDWSKRKEVRPLFTLPALRGGS